MAGPEPLGPVRLRHHSEETSTTRQPGGQPITASTGPPCSTALSRNSRRLLESNTPLPCSTPARLVRAPWLPCCMDGWATPQGRAGRHVGRCDILGGRAAHDPAGAPVRTISARGKGLIRPPRPILALPVSLLLKLDHVPHHFDMPTRPTKQASLPCGDSATWSRATTILLPISGSPRQARHLAYSLPRKRTDRSSAASW